jgi:ankyrin repeat protein
MQRSDCAGQSEVRFSNDITAPESEYTSTENNLFLVKRLIQRTDMRNPDPSTKRYTSLAWAAVLGHEETFEFLLTAGHDDEELSKVLLFFAGIVNLEANFPLRIRTTIQFLCS